MEPLIGQIQAFGFNWAPVGWVPCNGQLLSISQYQILYALIGATFGGDGYNTFAVPDLRGRTIIGAGQGPGLSNILYTQKGGAESVALTLSNLPNHVHPFTNGDGQTLGTVNVTTYVKTVDNTNESPETNNGENVLGTAGSMPSIYRESPSGTDHLGGVTSAITGSTSAVGGNAPFGIRNPYLGMLYCIATEGIYPTRS